MKMWFKNLYLFQMEKGHTITAEELAEKLQMKPFYQSGKEQRESTGFVSPYGCNGAQLVHATGKYLLFTLAHQEKLLPASVIREELDERVAEIEDREGRKVGNKEKKDLRDEVEFDLLAQAFTRTKRVDAYFDLANGWLIVNTSSDAMAERVTNKLRAALGSLPASIPVTDVDPQTLMTSWLRSGFASAPFTLGERVSMQSTDDDKSTVTFNRQELTAEEVLANLEAGKVVTKLGLVWDEKISFTLADDLRISGVKFLDVLEDSLKDADPQSHAEKLDIEFALMAGEVSTMLTDLFLKDSDNG